MTQITMDDATLQTLQNKYADLQTQSEQRLGQFSWPASPALPANLNATLPVKAGDKGFTPGTQLATAIEQVRAGLADRLNKFKTDAYDLHWALVFLRQNNNDTENFNSMTAADWAGYQPKS